MAFSLLALSVGGMPAAAEPSSTVPTLDSATPVDDGVSLAYTAPSVPTGSTITSYEYQISPDGVTPAGEANTNSFVGFYGNTTATTDPYTDPNGPAVCGQNNPCYYRIQAQIDGGTSQSDWSGWVAVAPSFTAPILDSATPVDDGVSLAYTAPSVPTGSTITSYEYQISPDGVTPAGEANTNSFVGFYGNTTATTDPYTDPNGPAVCGQNNPCYYRIQAQIGGGTWQTPWSDWVAISTFTAPTLNGVTPVNDGVSLAFTAPSVPTGSTITSYEYQISPDGVTPAGEANTNSFVGFYGNTTATTDPYTDPNGPAVCGQNNPCYYRIQAQIGGGTWQTPWSDWVAISTFTAPSLNRVTSVADGVSLAFTAPGVPAGSTITSYDYQISPDGVTPVADANTISFVGFYGNTTATTDPYTDPNGPAVCGQNNPCYYRIRAEIGPFTWQTPWSNWASTDADAFAVTYDANGATSGTAPVDSDGPYVAGATVTVAANTGTLARTGYTFSGWNTAANGSGTSYPATGSATFTMPAANVVLYAEWTSTTHTVTYDANGATSGTVPVDADSPYTTGTTVTVAANTGSLARDGFDFSGWNTAANGSGTAYAATGSVTFPMPAANVVLYAQWTAVSHTVSFDANGGSGSMTDQTDNAPTALTANTFTRVGFVFAGWRTAADGSGTSYADQAVYPFDADATLYAQWTSNTHTVTYDGNGATSGTVPVDADSPHETGATVTVAANTGALARDEFAFAGWNTAADGNGTHYAATGSVTFPMPAADVVLYAQWTAVSHTVSFDANGGLGSMLPQTDNAPTALTANSFTRVGFVFAGWRTAADGSGTSYADQAVYPFDADATLYAQWAPTYTVSFDANGGSGSMTDQVDSAPAALTANSFTRSGFVFAGWDTAADGSGTSYADQAVYPFDADATLYAQWTASTLTSRDQLLAVIADLQQHCTAPPCRDAIKHLTEAVAFYTTDGTELKVPGGEKFFDKLKEAADKLRKVNNNDTAAGAPDRLWGIAKQLVEAALAKAIALGGRQNEISAATHELAEATKRWPKHLHGAFEHLKKSWQHSQKALQ